MENSIYKDIAKRTGGDIYIGVVGPVRTGKSTFVHKFMEELVIPGIENDYDRERTTDCMPQSASGRTIMTTEPKFIPDESVKINTVDGATFNVKMVDCVGYLVDGAIDILSVLVKAELVPSRSEARRAVEQGGVVVNDEKITNLRHSFTYDDLANGILVRRGKKNFKKVVIK